MKPNEELIFLAIEDGQFNVSIHLKAGERLVKVSECEHEFDAVKSDCFGAYYTVCHKCGEKPNKSLILYI